MLLSLELNCDDLPNMEECFSARVDEKGVETEYVNVGSAQKRIHYGNHAQVNHATCHCCAHFDQGAQNEDVADGA